MLEHLIFARWYDERFEGRGKFNSDFFRSLFPNSTVIELIKLV